MATFNQYEIYNLIGLHSICDSNGNINVDISKCDQFSDKIYAKVFKQRLLGMLADGREIGKYFISLKLSPLQTRIHKYALEIGFRFYQADANSSLLIYRLEEI